jgi:hypothetical protein
VGKGAQEARVAAARELGKAVFRMLVTNRTYGEVEPYLAPQGAGELGTLHGLSLREAL